MSRETLAQLLARLEAISPLPADVELSLEIVSEYESILAGLDGVKDKQIIEPLILSFGYGIGFGLYWTALHLLESFGTEEIYPILVRFLTHHNPGTSLWATFMLNRIPDKVLIENVLPKLLLLAEGEYEMIRLEAMKAIKRVRESEEVIRWIN